MGLYLLKKIKDIIPQAFLGVYRNAGLALVQNANGPNLDRNLEKATQMFQRRKLKDISHNKHVWSQFLDVNLKGGGGGFRSIILETLILRYGLKGNARTRPDFIRVVLGAGAQLYPCEASEQK